MDIRLTDLDALLLTVRNPLSRGYIDEAIRAYRVGSLKAAIVAIWVAVSFDIIEKVRELAEEGDQAAAGFINTFDTNVTANNVRKLLEIEGDLLNDAETRFEFIDPISRRHFDRLKQDRNLCAHPAFTSEGQLFHPEPELVRLYIVEAVRNLLSQRPMQGKTILAMFDRDLRGSSFPQGPAEIPRFVEKRYLANSRKAVLSSFSQVLTKALLKAGSAAEWEGKLDLLPYALQAVKEHDAGTWSFSVLPTMIRLAETADDEKLPNAFQLLRLFPDLQAGLSQDTQDRLCAYIDNMQPANPDLRVFGATIIPMFTARISRKFASCPRPIQASIVARFPFPSFWQHSLQQLRGSGSFRGAETLFVDFIVPFQPVATIEQLGNLLTVVTLNDQIYFSANMPGLLAAFIRSVGERHSIQIKDTDPFIQFLDKNYIRPAYEKVTRAFADLGVAVPPLPQ